MCEGMILEPLGYDGTSLGIKVGEVLFSGDLDQVLVIGGLLLIGMIGGVIAGRR